MKKTLPYLLFLFVVNSISAKLPNDCINTFTYANSSDSITTTVVAVDAAAIITGNSSVCVGATSQLTGTGTPATTNPWISSDTSVATIGISGLVTGVSAGTATIIYTDSSEGSATFIVTVNPLPTASISGTQTICSGKTTTITFIGTPNATVTYTVNSGLDQNIVLDGSGSALLITPVLTASTTYTLVSVTSSGIPACSQPQSGSVVVTVRSAPKISTPSNYEVCDNNNNDGFSCSFNLEVLNAEITADPNVIITYHVTQMDAIHGVNPIPPGPFCNIVKNTQTIYVRAFDPSAPDCPSFTTLKLIVNPRPIPNANITNYDLCDINNPGDGVEGFDLYYKDAEIANGQAGVTITYYSTLSDAQNQNNPLPSVYTSGSATIWFNIKENIKGCFSVGSFKIMVNPLPNSAQPNYPPYSLCDNSASAGYGVFDLASKVPVILLGQSGMTVFFYPSLMDAQNNTNAITNLMYVNAVPNSQTLGIRIMNNTTGCYVISTMELRVEPLPIPVQSTPYTICDNNQDGLSTFYLTALTPGIANGQNCTITYHETLADAQSGVNPLSSTYSNTVPFVQVIYAAAVDNVTGCRSVVPIELSVLPSPVMPVLPNLTICDQDSNTQDQMTYFDFTGLQNFILAQSIPGAYKVIFYEDENLTTPIISFTNYTGSNNQTIWVMIKDTAQAQACINVGSFKLIVDSCTTAFPDTDLEQALIDLGYDTVLDGKVLNSSLSEVTELDLSNKNITDLAGLEVFANLTSLNLANNNLTSLNFGSSVTGKNVNTNFLTSLTTLICSGNQLLTSLDISGLSSLENLDCSANPGLTCINVKDVTEAELNTTWIKDATASYSTTCSKLAIDTPSLNNFRVVAYPNPSKNGFAMDVNTLSQEVLRIKVYDMIGKLVDQMEVNPNMISSQRIGQNYSSGIYNIIVTQDEEVKTLRIIKQ